MISVTDAQTIILDQALRCKVETVELQAAYGRVLRQDICADRDQPAFNKSTMDGVALRMADWQKGTRRFKIQRVIAAGQSSGARALPADHCVQIMTGAVVPPDCDAVIPIEQIKIMDRIAHIADVVVKSGDFIRARAADCRKGEVILKEGVRLTSPAIASAASFGYSRVRVSRMLNVAIVATGDELVDLDRKNIKPYQIRLSNSYALDCALRQTGLCTTQMFHFIDDPKTLRRNLQRILMGFDAVVLSGGVSMGSFDFVPQVLADLKVKMLFHKVAQKPGKPFWFGVAQRQVAIFALPGNPVSTHVCAYRYVIPYLHKTVGLPYNKPSVFLSKKILNSSKLTLFVPVKMSCVDGKIVAQPVASGGSGDFTSLSNTDGFIELGCDRQERSKNNTVSFYSW